MDRDKIIQARKCENHKKEKVQECILRKPKIMTNMIVSESIPPKICFKHRPKLYFKSSVSYILRYMPGFLDLGKLKQEDGVFKAIKA